METRRQQQKQEAANAPASGLALLGFPPSWEFDAAFGNIWKLSGRNFRVALEFVNAIGLLYFWSLLRSPVQSCHIKGRIVISYHFLISQQESIQFLRTSGEKPWRTSCGNSYYSCGIPMATESFLWIYSEAFLFHRVLWNIGEQKRVLMLPHQNLSCFHL